jgi:diguanylate cyclase (GGDEF)-like protein
MPARPVIHSEDLLAADTERSATVHADARFLVFLLCVGAFVAMIGAGQIGMQPPSAWSTFGILAAAAAVAQLFGVLTPYNQSYHLAIVFVLAGALLLPPALVVLLCVVQHVPEWVRDRLPVEIQTFNIANYTLAAIGASVAARVLLGAQGAGADSRTLAAGLAAGAAFVLLNHGVLACMLRVARGHSLRQSGLFTPESLTTDFVLALTGLGLAAWWNVNPWFLPVAIAPLLIIHRALSIPTLRAEARRDPKTGLYNAGYLNSVLASEMDRAVRFARPLSVIVADLDYLRRINNGYGHLAGDAVLLGVADVFRAELRPSDVAARFGGEEFAIVLPETGVDDALAIADRIRCAVAGRSFLSHDSDDPVRATLSLGVSSYPQHAQDAGRLVHQADLALYRAKALGRNRACTATAETQALSRLIERASRHDENGGPRGFLPYGAPPPAQGRRLKRAQLATITALTRSMEAKDSDTGGHTERVAGVAAALAHRLGYRGEELEAIQVGGLLHDIGKIGIPESVLNKPGPLSEEEWATMREHPVISDYILAGVDLHPFVRQIARSGHERIDGQGYPDRLAGNDIPLPARIALVADAFDAITSDRVYRPARSIDAALQEIQAHAGTQFCPLVVHALEQLFLEQPETLEPEPELLPEVA